MRVRIPKESTKYFLILYALPLKELNNLTAKKKIVTYYVKSSKGNIYYKFC